MSLEDDALLGQMVRILAQRGRLVLFDREDSRSRCEYIADDPRFPKLAAGEQLDEAVGLAFEAIGGVRYPKPTRRGQMCGKTLDTTLREAPLPKYSACRSGKLTGGCDD